MSVCGGVVGVLGTLCAVNMACVVRVCQCVCMYDMICMCVCMLAHRLDVAVVGVLGTLCAVNMACVVRVCQCVCVCI